MKFRFIILLLCSIALPTHAVVIEEWLEPWVELKTNNGEWELTETRTLPLPPLHILSQQKNMVMLLINRQPTWVSRVSVRLDEERPIILNCQISTQDHAEDYQNFGIRGKESNTIGQECADDNQLIQQQ